MGIPALSVVAAATALAALASSEAAQARPNFSGTWIAISPADQAGLEEVITHTATELRMEHPSEGGSHAIVYKLNGAETRNVLESHGEEVVSLVKATWQDDTLVVQEITTYPDGRKAEFKARWRIDAEGRLVREVAATIGGQTQPTITVIARRKSP